MIRFNLLPYRQYRVEQRKRRFLWHLGACCLGAMVFMAATTGFIQAQLDRQVERNAKLTEQENRLSAEVAEVNRLENEISTLNRRIETIISLQADRGLIHTLLMQVVKTVPADVSLIDFNYTGGKVELTGNTASSERLADWVERLSTEDGFRTVNVKVVRDENNPGFLTAPISAIPGAQAQFGATNLGSPTASFSKPRNFILTAESNRRGPDLSGDGSTP